MLKPFCHRSQECPGAVDREHPYGSFACQMRVAPAEREKTGPQALQAPAQNAALKKFVFHIFHSSSFPKMEEYIHLLLQKGCIIMKKVLYAVSFHRKENGSTGLEQAEI